MKSTVAIVILLGLMGVLTVMAQEVKPEKAEVIDLGNGVKLEMILIPAGTFMMGSPKNEMGRFDDETQHEVTLTKSFYIGKYEVTQEQWESVMEKNPSTTRGPKLPVTRVSWEDCQEFIKKLNAKTAGGYRLPSEAEWEYACRARTTTVYSFGDQIRSTRNYANYWDGTATRPLTVGTYKPNSYGLYDMHGNAWEWCEDWYGKYPKGAVTDPKGPITGEGRVHRGGSFNTKALYARSSCRAFSHPFYGLRSTGLRVARTK